MYIERAKILLQNYEIIRDLIYELDVTVDAGDTINIEKYEP